MNPAILPIPLLSIPPLGVSVPSAAPAQCVDFGALLMAQPTVPAAQAQTATLSAKLPEAMPAPQARGPDEPALPVELPTSVQQLPESLSVQIEVEAHQITETDKAESAPVADLPIAMSEQAPQPPQAHTPDAVPVAPLPVQQKLAPPAKSPTKERVNIVVDAKALTALDLPSPARVAIPAESAMPLAPAAFGELTAVAAKPERADPLVQLGERVLDVARGNVWLDQLASDIIAAQDESRDLKFRLIPPQLGQLDVRIETQERGMQLNFSAQTEEAAQIIAAAQPRLIEELRGQGVRVAGSDVATSSGQSFGGGQSQRQPPAPQQDLMHLRPSKPIPPAEAGRFA